MNSETTTQIVGIMLLRNEDVFIEWVVTNIAGFCDQILVADHQSTDKTSEKLSKLAERYPWLQVYRIASAAESHELIATYADSPTWIFAIDGDEIYDPGGLAKLRPRLLRGDFDDWWQIFGNVLNCTRIDAERQLAQGYLAPPCRSMTKLFNFNAIQAWRGSCPERLHGGDIIFKPEFLDAPRCNLHEQNPWDDAEYRCLHTCFMKRSTQEDGAMRVRRNLSELNAADSQKLHRRLLQRLGGRSRMSAYKARKYMRGSLVTKNITMFRPPGANFR